MTGDKVELRDIIDDINVDKVGIVNLGKHKDTEVYKTAVELLTDAKSVIVLANELFAEVPGLFLVRPDQTLYASNIVTMPFTRPHFKDVLGALDVIIERDYPARGEA